MLFNSEDPLKIISNDVNMIIITYMLIESCVYYSFYRWKVVRWQNQNESIFIKSCLINVVDYNISPVLGRLNANIAGSSLPLMEVKLIS